MRRLTWPEGVQAPQHGATVHVTVSKNKDQQEDLTLSLHRVSRHGVIDLQLVAERVEVRPSLVGLAARAVAAKVAGTEEDFRKTVREFYEAAKKSGLILLKNKNVEMFPKTHSLAFYKLGDSP